MYAENNQKRIEDYLYAEREPLRDHLLDLIEEDRPSVLKRKSIGDRLLNKVVEFVDTFINGIVVDSSFNNHANKNLVLYLRNFKLSFP